MLIAAWALTPMLIENMMILARSAPPSNHTVMASWVCIINLDLDKSNKTAFDHSRNTPNLVPINGLSPSDLSSADLKRIARFFPTAFLIVYLMQYLWVMKKRTLVMLKTIHPQPSEITTLITITVTILKKKEKKKSLWYSGNYCWIQLTSQTISYQSTILYLEAGPVRSSLCIQTSKLPPVSCSDNCIVRCMVFRN